MEADEPFVSCTWQTPIGPSCCQKGTQGENLVRMSEVMRRCCKTDEQGCVSRVICLCHLKCSFESLGKIV